MIAIKGGKLLTVTHGIIENGTILIEDGKIKAVGQNVQIPQGAEVINAEGKWVTPGLIDVHTHISTFAEPQPRPVIHDGNETSSPNTAQIRGIDGLNPRDMAIRVARNAGFTTCYTGPGSANVIGGTFVAIKLYGKRVDKMILKDPVAMKVAFGENPKRCYGNMKKSPSTRMATAALLREMLFKTKRYMEDKERAEKEGKNPPPFDMKLEAMIPVLKKEIPIKAHAHRADDIFTSIRIAREFGIGITLDHCTDGSLIADELAAEGLPAFVGPSLGKKSKIELANKSFATPGELTRAGVKVSIITDAPVIPLANLPLCAGMAVRAGMDIEDAWKAITINPAESIGIADRVGSLEVGKDADVVIHNGNPLTEVTSTVATAIIDGKIIYQE